ncbi:MAG: ATP-binding protein [Polyangia bacterium]
MTGQAPASSLPPSPRALTQRLVIASIISMITLAVVCGFGISSLRRLSALSDTEVAQRMTLLNESEVFQLVLFQKGFAVDYMFTGDERWLRELERSRKEFAEWLPETQRTADSEEERDLLRRIDEAYRALDRERSDMLARYKEGRLDEVKQSLQRTHTMMQSLVSLSQEFVHAASAQARSERDAVQSTMRRDTTLLLGGSLFGMAASLLVGFFVARRVARPIYELQLQVESAAQRTRIEVPPGRAGFEALGEHMGAILRKIEETDAAIAEQRRRLIQSEKMSAIGEVTAKLAHEILNPLAGIKAAVQLLARTRDEGPAAIAARDTAHVISSEIARVEQLVRRLLTYARPLSPRLQVSEVVPLLDLASDAGRSELARAGVTLERRVAEDLPEVEVDPVLITQALSNLLINAAQASTTGGRIHIRADRRELDGNGFISIRVIDDGPGIAPEVLPKLFQPFFTTKPHGNGLGLVISQHIAREHGGSLFARNREDARGAEFELLLPVAPPAANESRRSREE